MLKLLSVCTTECSVPYLTVSEEQISYHMKAALANLLTGTCYVALLTNSCVQSFQKSEKCFCQISYILQYTNAF